MFWLFLIIHLNFNLNRNCKKNYQFIFLAWKWSEANEINNGKHSTQIISRHSNHLILNCSCYFCRQWWFLKEIEDFIFPLRIKATEIPSEIYSQLKNFQGRCRYIQKKITSFNLPLFISHNVDYPKDFMWVCVR